MSYLSILFEKLAKFPRGYFFWHTKYMGWEKIATFGQYLAISWKWYKAQVIVE